MDELDELRLRIAKAKGWKFPDVDIQCDVDYLIHHYQDEIPDWSRSIADMWELVEEMKATAYSVGIYMLEGGWNCYVCYRYSLPDDPEEYHQLILETHGTAPEAICRCWLSWKEKGNA